MSDALRNALADLEICANTVDGCYSRNPGNFAAALRDLRDSAERARAALAALPEQQPQAPEPEVRDLIAEIRRACTGTTVWRAENDDGSGSYSMEFDWKPEAERWFADNPNASRGRHIKERLIFSEAEELALKAADALRAVKQGAPAAPALTDEQIAAIWNSHECTGAMNLAAFGRAVRRALVHPAEASERGKAP